MSSTDNKDLIENLKTEKPIGQSFEIYRSNPQMSLQLAEEALAISVKEVERGKALACRGSCYVWLGSYDNALKDLFDAL